MTEPNELTDDVQTGPGDAHAQQETLKTAFPGEASEESKIHTFMDPDTSLLSTGYGDALRIPTEVLGTFWRERVETSARSANAPRGFSYSALGS